MNRTTATHPGRKRRATTKARDKPPSAPVMEFRTTEQPDAVERRELKASRWYGEYVPDRGYPPEDRPA